jgi:hypothetical protein
MKKLSKKDRIKFAAAHLGIPTPDQAKKIKVASKFLDKNVYGKSVRNVDVALCQLSFEEFKIVFGKSALELTEFQSIKRAENVLLDSYLKIIIQAVREGRDNVSTDGLSRIAFRAEHLTEVRRYCRVKNIEL